LAVFERYKAARNGRLALDQVNADLFLQNQQLKKTEYTCPGHYPFHNALNQ
jgi:hypothetical protein